MLKIAELLRGSPEAVDEILYRIAAAVADPLLLQRDQALLFGIVYVDNNVITATVQVTDKENQCDHSFLTSVPLRLSVGEECKERKFQK